MVLLDKWNLKHLSPRKALITGTIVTLMIAVTFMTLVAAASWEVTVTDDGNVITLKTTKSTVGAVLKEAGIALTPEDIVSAAADTPISEQDKSASHVHLTFKSPIWTEKKQSAALCRR